MIDGARVGLVAETDGGRLTGRLGRPVRVPLGVAEGVLGDEGEAVPLPDGVSDGLPLPDGLPVGDAVPLVVADPLAVGLPPCPPG